MEASGIARGWHDLYVMLGTSTAALIGLLFIATSLHIGEVVSNLGFRIRAYNGTLYLLTLLVEAVLVLSPQPAQALGLEICALNLVGLAFPLKNFYRYLYKNADAARRAGIIVYRGVTYALAYIFGVVGGAGIAAGSHWGMFIVTASYTTLMVAVVIGAWAIMLGIGQTESVQK